MHHDAASKQAARPPWARSEWIALGAITLIGAFLRLYLLHIYPPGVHFDEAVYGLQAETIYRGEFPVFFQAYTGREPFYMYLVALVYLFTGPGTFGLRLASALIGTITIPVTYLAFREMFDRRVALLGALTTATAYWHFNVTRTGFCWTLMPLVEAVSIYFLWRGYREGKTWLMVVGGAAAGSMLYIYLAARLFPVTLVFILLYLLIADRQRFRARWRSVALSLAAAVLIFVPLGVHFARNPHDIWERGDQVGVWAQAGDQSPLAIVAENVVQMGITYLPHWNWSSRYSLHGKPVFDWLIGPFFLLGVALALWRWRKPQYGVLLLWWIGMSLPPIFTAEPMPVGQRMFGAIPAVYGLAALGMAETLRWAARRRNWQTIAVLGIGALLAVETVWNGIHYFTVWGPSPSTYYGFHSDYVVIGELIRPEMAADHRVIIASEHYRHPSTVITEPLSVKAKWLVGKRLMVLPAWDGREVDYFVPVAYANAPVPALKILESVACSKEDYVNRVGDVGVVLYRICEPPLVQRPPAPVAILGDEVRLWNLQVPDAAQRGDALRVAMEWEVIRAATGERNFALHLVDDQGVRWTQVDEIGYLPPEWQPGDQVWQWLELPLDVMIPPGRYHVRLILSGDQAVPMTVRDASDALTGVYVDAGEVTLAGGDRWMEPQKESAPLLGAVRAFEWTRLNVDKRPGEEILAEVTWQLAEAASAPATVRLGLTSPDGSTAANWEYSLATEYPVMQWQPGELVRQRYLLRLPSGLGEGEYTLRASVGGNEGLSIGKVRVAGVPRIMEPPAMQHPMASPVTLGDKVELLGYDLARDTWAAGDAVELTLYWRALAPMEEDYHVFVHVLRDDGGIETQRDAAPAEWTRPTTGWVAGEVIADGYTFVAGELPPGVYRIAVGMYDPETMTRLEMRTVEGERLPDDQFLLQEIRVQ